MDEREGKGVGKDSGRHASKCKKGIGYGGRLAVSDVI